jgi:hypothetical protein
LGAARQIALRIGDSVGTALMCTVFRGAYSWNTLSSATNGYLCVTDPNWCGEHGTCADGACTCAPLAHAPPPPRRPSPPQSTAHCRSSPIRF